MSYANGKGAGTRRATRSIAAIGACVLGTAAATAATGVAQIPPVPVDTGTVTGALPGQATTPASTGVTTTPAPGTTATIAPGSTITVPAAAGGPQQPAPAQAGARAVGPDTPLPVGTGFNTLGPPSPRSRPELLRPFPIVRIAGRLTRAGASIRVLSVRAPRGSRVVALCRGRGCPRRASSAMVRARAARTGRVRFARLQRSLRAGVRIQVFVTKPGKIGKYTRFTIRKGLAPERGDACLAPTGSGRRPGACPSGSSR